MNAMTTAPQADTPADDAPQRIDLDDLATGPAQGRPLGLATLDLIKDVKVKVEVQLGNAEMTVAELAALKVASVIPLDRTLDAPLDLLMNGRVVARGELVAVGDHFGVRITSVAELVA